MNNRLEGELIRKQAKLSGLRRDTHGAIGELASHAYSELNKRPDNGTGPFPSLNVHGDPRFFKSYHVTRATEMPDGPVPMDATGGIVITRTATELDRRDHYFTYAVHLPLPARYKGVQVSYTHGGINNNVGVSKDGLASYKYTRHETSPKITDPTKLSRGPYGYGSPEDLESDYARAYGSGLVVASFVAAGLDRVHGIQSDIKEILSLQERWQRLQPKEMHPGIAVLISDK